MDKKNIIKKPWEGHREDLKRFQDVIEEGFKIGIPHSTFWGAYKDNLIKRNHIEVSFLVQLIHEYISHEETHNFLQENQIYIRCIGQWDEILKNKKLNTDILKLEKILHHTKIKR